MRGAASVAALDIFMHPDPPSEGVFGPLDPADLSRELVSRGRGRGPHGHTPASNAKETA